MTKETEFRDWNRNWLWNSAQNKLICIDTEDNSFLIGMYRGVEGMDIPNHCLFNYVASLMIWRNSMEPEAGDWFDETLNELLNDQKALEANIPLPQNTKYDDLVKGIDFQKVKKEYSG